MSLSAMKYALDVLDNYVEDPRCETHCVTAIHFLRQAIEQAEKQEPVAWREVVGKTTHYYDYNEEGRGEPLYATPVHAIDMSQERVDETAKGKHEWVGLDDDIPGLGLVTEEFYNGMLCAEDILRKRNT
jgi:hypothetical protein